MIRLLPRELIHGRSLYIDASFALDPFKDFVVLIAFSRCLRAVEGKNLSGFADAIFVLLSFSQIISGPLVTIRLRATVTMPELCVSDSLLDFSDVVVGQSRLIAIQLANDKSVPCEWSSTPLGGAGIGGIGKLVEKV